MIKDESYVLSNGVKIPKVGLGTWQSKPNDAYNAVLSALKLGYRHIDTAFVYGKLWHPARRNLRHHQITSREEGL